MWREEVVVSKTTKYIGQKIRRCSLGSNWVPLEYKSEMVLLLLFGMSMIIKYGQVVEKF
jgi:hypothetical protein